MLTENFSKLWSGRDYKGMDGSSVTASNANQTVWYNFIKQTNANYVNSATSPGLKLDVGFSDAELTKSAVVLADGNYSNSKLANVSVSNVTKTGDDIISMAGIFRNNGSENVVVKEIGLYAIVCPSSYPTVSMNGLIARTVLSTPVTIAPGEQYSFTYRITI